MENRCRLIEALALTIAVGSLACGPADPARDREVAGAADLAVAGTAGPRVGGPSAQDVPPAGFIEWAASCPYPYRLFHPPDWGPVPVIDPESMRRSLDARGGRRLTLDVEGWLGTARAAEQRAALTRGPDSRRVGAVEIMGEEAEVYLTRKGEVSGRRVYTLFAPLERLGDETVFYGRLRATSSRSDPGARYVGDDTVLQVLGGLELNRCG